jgi:hypothetical protein
MPDHVHSHTVSSIEIKAPRISLMRKKIVVNPPGDGDQSTHQRHAYSDDVKQSRAAGLLDRKLK